MTGFQTGMDYRLSCEFLCIAVFSKFPLISFMCLLFIKTVVSHFSDDLSGQFYFMTLNFIKS